MEARGRRRDRVSAFGAWCSFCCAKTSVPLSKQHLTVNVITSDVVGEVEQVGARRQQNEKQCVSLLYIMMRLKTPVVSNEELVQVLYYFTDICSSIT